MKDYYKILGVNEEASEKEIRARWLELTKCYHPDAEKGIENEEKIKEINEAYEVLKDESTRFDYDIERALKKSFQKRAQRHQKYTEKRFFMKKILIPTGTLLLFFMIGLFLFRSPRVPIQPKSESRFEISKILEKKPAPPAPPPEVKEEVKVERKTQKEIEEGVKEERESERKGEPATKGGMKWDAGDQREKEAPIEKELKRKEEVVPSRVMKSEIPGKVDKEVLKEATPVTLQPGEKLQSKTKEEKEVPKEIGHVISQKSAKIDQPKPIVTEPQPVQKPETSVNAERVVSILSSSLAKEEEVKQFLSNYINRYTRKDINGFLSFFSSKAVQNQKDDFEKMRSIYTEFFDQSEELRYSLKGLKIEIYQNSVEVKARYSVDQKLKKRGKEKIWEGNIRWVLVKEEGALRISLLDYQNEKSPKGEERR